MNAVFATHNEHKLEEISKMLPEWLEIKSISSLGYVEDIPENGQSLQENALIKAKYAFEKTQAPICFADDTGLEVMHLNGAPGIFSARFAGEGCNASDNIKKLLNEMKSFPRPMRLARFRTVIALLLNGETHIFEGRVNGEILMTPTEGGGFGYDPVFQPEAYECSFAQMPLELKNKISHRGQAFAKMKAFLEAIRENKE